MGLSPYVHLYRASGRPDVQSGVFNGRLDFNDENVKLVEDLIKGSWQAFRGIWIDGKVVDEDDPFPNDGSEIRFEVQCPGGSADRFHNKISDFIRDTPGLSKGEMPNDFYIVDDDFYSKEDPHPKKIVTLAAICLLIQRLSQLAHYHAAIKSIDHEKLIFLQPNETESATPIELITKVDESMLDCEPPDACLINELCSKEIKTSLHFVAKKGVFGVTLAEFMAKSHSNQGDFSYLVRNWRNFINLYQKNLETYLSGFAFHKATREVSEAELQIAEKFSKITSEITGKLLSIPVSFAVIIAVFRAESLVEGLLLVGSLLLAAFIISGSVRNQQKQLERISHGKELLFNSFEGRKESYPKELKRAIEKMVNRAQKDESDLRRILEAFQAIAWVPFVVAFIIMLYKYHLNDAFKQMVSYFMQ